MKMLQIPALTALAVAATLAVSTSHATLYQWTAILDGPSENPANASPGTGFAAVDWDTVSQMMTVNVTFSGLTGPTTASHIHAPVTIPGGTAGVATTTPYFAGFPIGVTSGTYLNTLDMSLASSYNPSYVTANGGTVASAEAALLAAMLAGNSYLNIHSQTFPGGEIRGFLIPVPEPATWALVAGGLVTLLSLKRRKA
jgi:hypothetical protein